jgi:hypothetical protein
MLDSLRQLVVKSAPERTEAEKALEVTEQGQKDREARLQAEAEAAAEAQRQGAPG